MRTESFSQTAEGFLMPAPRKSIGRPRKTVTLVNAAAGGSRGGRPIATGDRNGRAILDLMREIGYAQPAVIGEFQDLR
jgi:hypothetical protein